jgi:hypothetical protein
MGDGDIPGWVKTLITSLRWMSRKSFPDTDRFPAKDIADMRSYIIAFDAKHASWQRKDDIRLWPPGCKPFQ